MKKTAFYSFLIISMFAGLLTADAQTAKTDSSDQTAAPIAQNTPEQNPQAFKAGGTLINIPNPSADLVEVGYDVREQMEIFVPGSNRLLSGYMRPADIPLFMNGDGSFILAKYASIQVPRRGEFTDCTVNDFNELVDYVKGSLSKDMDQIIDQSEAEFNQRMKSMDLEKVSIDKPVQLGTFFSKPDAYSMGMVSKYSNEKTSWTLVISTTFIRVKDRLLFVYIFSTYKNEEDIDSVRKLSEHWADAILAANK